MFSPIVSLPLTQAPSAAGRRRCTAPRASRSAAWNFLLVSARPPVADLAGLVELAALVVEAVADLVADDRADGAVVHRRIGVRIEERRLQDRGRERDLVHQRVVVGVDRLRVHAPLVAIDRLAEARDLAVPLELARRCARSRSSLPFSTAKRRVVAPLRRIADARIEGRELLLRFGARRVVHPRQRLEALAHRRAQVGDELVHLALCPGGKYLAT